MNEKIEHGGGECIVNENKTDAIVGLILIKLGIFCIRISVMLAMYNNPITYSLLKYVLAMCILCYC